MFSVKKVSGKTKKSIVLSSFGEICLSKFANCASGAKKNFSLYGSTFGCIMSVLYVSPFFLISFSGALVVLK